MACDLALRLMGGRPDASRERASRHSGSIGSRRFLTTKILFLRSEDDRERFSTRGDQAAQVCQMTTTFPKSVQAPLKWPFRAEARKRKARKGPAVNVRSGFLEAIGNTPLIRLRAASDITGCD